jgi:lipoprotein-anchoring transpeptidase ErfK/SrfK
MLQRKLIGLAAAALMTLTASVTLPATANAQFWSGASGQSTVSFSKRYRPGEVIVSFGDRRLYYVTARGRAVSYPIAVPRPNARWSGVLRISQKRVNPGWTPTPRMRRENPKLPAHVPGGHRMNPLGSRAMYLGSTLYRIHGTDAPWTIGRNVSSGCIRMHNAHAEDLYRRVRVGTRVTATWKRYQTSPAGYQTAEAGNSTSSSGDLGWRRQFLRP